jgi:hypothetical protein
MRKSSANGPALIPLIDLCGSQTQELFLETSPGGMEVPIAHVLPEHAALALAGGLHPRVGEFSPVRSCSSSHPEATCARCTCNPE